MLTPNCPGVFHPFQPGRTPQVNSGESRGNFGDCLVSGAAARRYIGSIHARQREASGMRNMIDFTDTSSGGTNLVIISYTDQYQMFPTVNWTMTKLNSNDADNLLDKN